MCLIIDKNCLRIFTATTDIVCYKIIQHYSQLNILEMLTVKKCLSRKYQNIRLSNHYFSPFRFDLVVFDKLLTAEGNTDVLNFSYEGFINNDHEIHVEGGAFHSYTDIESLINDICGAFSFKIAECIIPKGTKYVEGFNDNRYPNYASEKIIYKKILDL